MNLVFVETRGFSSVLAEYFEDDESYRRFQEHLMENPYAGAVMKGCGGLRKVRWQDPKRGKGKRSGLRVIYLHLPEFAVLGLVDIYGKNESEDLTSAERRILSQQADGFRSDIQERRRKR